MKILSSSRAKFQQGVTMIEYALIAAAISIAAVTLLPGIGSAIKNTFTTINTSLG